MRYRRWPWIFTNNKTLGSEADMIGITADRFATEFEIKRYKSDFQADFNKKNKHRLLREGKHAANYFYFVCPSGLIEVSEIPSLYGLIWIEKIEPTKSTLRRKRSNEDLYKIIVKKPAKRLHSNKIKDHMLIGLLSSTMYKYFKLFLEQD